MPQTRIARIVLLALHCSLFTGMASCARQAQTQATEPAAIRLTGFTIQDLAFMAGQWRGDQDGRLVEEFWSAPAGNNMIGCFRWLRADGRAMVFELLAMTQEADGVRLRLRHHSATLVAKEEKDQPLTLRLAEVRPGFARFIAEAAAGDLDNITYTVQGEMLTINVAFKALPAGTGAASGKAREPLVFVLSRG